MTALKTKSIFTIGHSTHSLEEFIEMLRANDIKTLIDVRRYPGSRKFPQFNKEEFAKSLEKEGFTYIHLEDLGGRRKVQKDSKNTRWRNASFQGYADYMETEEFKEGVERLEEIAENGKTAMMCSEAVWWRCHRSMVSDYLKAKGWKVMHIMGAHNVQEHPYTSPASVKDGKLSYSE